MTSINKTEFDKAARSYLTQLTAIFTPNIIGKVENLCIFLNDAWVNQRQVFLCGNGGSAADALHIANDMHYGIGACGPARSSLECALKPFQPTLALSHV